MDWQRDTAALSEDERATLLAQLLDRQASSTSLLLYTRAGVRAVPLVEGETLIVGRYEPADVPIDDDSLSRQHVHIELVGGAVWVQDLGSTNGTWVNGERVERAQVGPGDRLAFGTIAAAVHALVGDELGVESHDRLVEGIETEALRARAFHRPLALVMLRSRAGDAAGAWLEVCKPRLRPFDRMALYSADTVELLLVETGTEAAVALAHDIDADVPVLAGVAVVPEHAGSGNELLDLARGALLAASSEQPVCTPAQAEAAAEVDGPVKVSAQMRQVFDTVERVAASNLPVLLIGETGTGKEVVSRAIHEHSRRRDGPMLCVNCGAIPSDLVESTLFGHERGAFTGATQQARGVFESANGGTVFLDEIGELPPAAQSSLLRVLENKTFNRVGSSEALEADVRIVAATHRDLEAMVAGGGFRQDLLFRLNAMTVRIPPLRERREEIEPFALRFVREANRANGTRVARIAADALELLRHYAWPGNVRELRNAIERAVVIARGDAICVEDLPERVRDLGAIAAPAASGPAAELSGLGGPVNLKAEVNRFEAGLITRALRQTDWDRRAAAELLGIPLRTLAHKIGVHDIKRE